MTSSDSSFTNKQLDLYEELLNKGMTEYEIFNMVGCFEEYFQTFHLLSKYDEGEKTQKTLPSESKQDYELMADKVKLIIEEFKNFLKDRGENIEFFGIPHNGGIESVVCNIYQTVGEKDAYPNLLDKAVHLFYFLVKNHPFIDGNKRIAAFCFVWFLEMNNWMQQRKEKGKTFSFNTMYALAIFVAESNPSEKDKIIKLMRNIIIHKDHPIDE